MRRHVTTLALCLLLAACDPGEHGNAKADGNGTDGADTGAEVQLIGNSVSVDVPGFKAKIAVPGIKLNAGTTDIDGMPLAPGTTVDGLHVDQPIEGGRSTVTMEFTSPLSTADLDAYYRKAGADAGFTIANAADGAITGGKDGAQRFRIVREATSSGSRGTITASDE